MMIVTGLVKYGEQYQDGQLGWQVRWGQRSTLMLKLDRSRNTMDRNLCIWQLSLFIYILILFELYLYMVNASHSRQISATPSYSYNHDPNKAFLAGLLKVPYRTFHKGVSHIQYHIIIITTSYPQPLFLPSIPLISPPIFVSTILNPSASPNPFSART